MISNAIPGVLSNSGYSNAERANGIAQTGSSPTDFQKILTSANAANSATAVKSSVTVTLVNSAKRPDDVSSSVKEVTNAKETADTSRTREEATTDNAQKAEKTTTEDRGDTRKVKDEKATETENSQNAENVKETSEPVEETVVNEAPVEEAESVFAATILEQANELMEMMATELDVDVKDIENAIMTLGLSPAQILDPTNLTQIVAQLTGADDVMAIVTNADLYLSVQNMQDAVTTTAGELMQQFNLSEEEFSSQLQEFTENAKAPQIQEEKAVENTFINVPAFEVNISEPTYEATKVTVSVDNETKPDLQPVHEFSLEEAVSEITSQTTQDTSGRQRQSSSENNENTDGSFFNQLTNQISSSLSEVAEPAQVQQTYVREDAAKIMEQITEFIKINIREEATTMELQLHPASLGTVNVMLEQAKTGNMVAKFVTQNEDVRAAIESQLQILQEKFNEQGVKVTAIEVTVNAGGFDQTLNDSQSQKEDDQDAQASIRKPMRRINLGDLSLEEMEEIDEEDQLTAEMMAINGNSVDFSA